MAVTETFTVRDVVTAALRKIGVVAADEAVSAVDMADGIEALNFMLKSWQRKRYLKWTYTEGSKTLTTAASYTLSPIRPIRIHSARYKSTGGVETPMQRLTRDEYFNLPIKTTTGIPTSFYYDKQREAAKLYVWPVLASATTESIEYTYEREMEDIAAAGDTPDVPIEWYECVIYNLAATLSDDFEKDAQKVEIKALALLNELLADEVEDSVYFLEAH